jgi:hypothetical protein
MPVYPGAPKMPSWQGKLKVRTNQISPPEGHLKNEQ